MSGFKKRVRDENPAQTKRRGRDVEEDNMEEDEMVFEDPFGDVFEEEEMVGDAHDSDDDLENATMDEEGRIVNVKNDVEDVGPTSKQVWRPGVDALPEGEELDYDPSAYIMYHSLRTEWPCLSFDILKDSLGDNRQRFPLTMYMVTGSQADRPEKNKVTLLEVSDIYKTYVAPDSDDESDNDEDLDEDPVIKHVDVPHYGGVNRIRNMPQNAGVVATMADTGKVHIYDLSAAYKSLLAKQVPVAPTCPIFTYGGHTTEGYALDWSPVTMGRLATGDCNGKIHVWNYANTGAAPNWNVTGPYNGHRASVEDIQWSPTEATVFASASADRTVRIWDIRDQSKSQIGWDAHTDDVNVISWNKNVGYLLASGSDDGSFKVWDLRSVSKNGPPLAHFTFHKAPITSIEWAPHDESMLAACSDDNQLSVWDLSVEADDEAGATAVDPSLAEYPPQLLFLHMGQTFIKELHFHPQIPGAIVSTAEDSFNIFKPAISVANS